MREILRNGEDVLKQKAERVIHPDSTLKEVVDDMMRIRYYHNGNGLAAPQIGVSKMIIVAELKDEYGQSGIYVMINPEIKKREGWILSIEKCLNLPGVITMLLRPWKLEVSYQGMVYEGRRHLSVKGQDAAILQHEIDHLNGKMLNDYWLL